MTTAVRRDTVLCVGRLYCDLIFTEVPRMPSLGTEVFANGFGLHAGGGAFITAAHFASLGHRAAISSFVPNPPFRDLVIAEVEGAGVDLSLCRPAEREHDPQVTVAIVANGDRAFLTRNAGAPAPELCANDISRIGARHVHVGELATLCASPGILSAAREAGASISLDCGWDETLTAERIGGLIAGVDVFLPNEGEVAHLRGIGVSEPFAPLTVIKNGAQGATAVSEEGELSAPAEQASVVDTTGAGDAFNAGFVSAWLSGHGLSESLRAGNSMGARAIAHRGGFHAGAFEPNMAKAGAFAR